MDYTPKPPPPHLVPRARDLWLSVTEEYELQDWQIELLQQACETLEVIAKAALAVQEHGLTYNDRFGAPHARPEVAELRQSRTLLRGLLRDLKLELAEDEEDPV